jgi:hypothetical protein
MKSLSPWHTNAAGCAPAFIKPAEIRQSFRLIDLEREHSKYVLLAKPLQSPSFSKDKHLHEQAKANTCGLPLVEYRSPSPFIRRENAVYVCANSAPVAQLDRATDF